MKKLALLFILALSVLTSGCIIAVEENQYYDNGYYYSKPYHGGYHSGYHSGYHHGVRPHHRR